MNARHALAGHTERHALAHPDLFTAVIERERRTRIRLTVFAYAYEVRASPLVTDIAFDKLARRSNTDIRTGLLDDWWRKNFHPATGQWIHNHPDLAGVARLYERLRRG